MKTTIFLKPSAELLNNVQDLLDTMLALIDYDCFSGQNPMRSEPKGILFWNWAILRIGTIDIPVPYHTLTETTSVLYDTDGTPQEMTHKECVLKNASFYLDQLNMIVTAIKLNIQMNRIKPEEAVSYAKLCTMLQGGIDFCNKHSDKYDSFFKAIEKQLH